MESKSVLIIDDEKDLLEVLKATLESRGYEVHVAVNGKKGLAQLKKHNPDVVILDLKMPKMNGMEFLTEMRANPRHKMTPVMVLSGTTKNARESDEHWRAKLGVSDYITKPFEPLDIIDRINALANGKELKK